MNSLNRALAGLTLALAVSTGCMEEIALVGRPTLQLDQDEIFAEIERVDTASWHLHLRLDDSRNRVVGYSADARALYQGREYPVAQLESGDKVSMQLRQDSRGNSYTDLVRVHESISDRNQSPDAVTSSPGPGIQTLDGRVAQVDFQRGSFEIRDESSERVIVSIPSDAQRSDVDRFRALRNGDHVRVEGRYLDRQRFELLTFLRDNR